MSQQERTAEFGRRILEAAGAAVDKEFQGEPLPEDRREFYVDRVAIILGHEEFKALHQDLIRVYDDGDVTEGESVSVCTRAQRMLADLNSQRPADDHIGSFLLQIAVRGPVDISEVEDK